MKKEKKKPIRNFGHKIISVILKIFIRKPKFVYLGEEVGNGSIILSNHVGTGGPLKWDLYFKKRFRFWGTHEMNSGLKSLYKYQSEVFYTQKKGWNKTASKWFCLLAAPLTYMFYRGLNLISTYPDARLKKTMDESINTLQNGDSIVIFPEDSSSGYHDTLTYFFAGFVSLAAIAYKKGIDTPIHVAYYNKSNNVLLIDAPVLYSQLLCDYGTRDKIAQELKNRTNRLGEKTKDIKK